MADCLFAKNATRCWQILSFILLLVVVVLLGVVIHLGIESSKSDVDSDIMPDYSSSKFIQFNYAGFFRTIAEQADFEENFSRQRQALIQPVCSMVDLDVSHLSLVFADTSNQTSLNVGVKSIRHHACCDSEVDWISPDTAIDENGRNVTVVQYPERRQYFQTETCCPVEGCKVHCSCYQEPYMTRALVNNPETPPPSVVVRTILIPGCCKCLND